jgi:hypothetical protein
MQCGMQEESHQEHHKVNHWPEKKERKFIFIFITDMWKEKLVKAYLVRFTVNLCGLDGIKSI